MDRVSIIYEVLQREQKPLLPREVFTLIKEVYFLEMLNDHRKKYEFQLFQIPSRGFLSMYIRRMQWLASKNLSMAYMIKQFSEYETCLGLYSKPLLDHSLKCMEFFRLQLSKIDNIRTAGLREDVDLLIHLQALKVYELLGLYLDTCDSVGGMLANVGKEKFKDSLNELLTE